MCGNAKVTRKQLFWNKTEFFWDYFYNNQCVLAYVFCHGTAKVIQVSESKWQDKLFSPCNAVALDEKIYIKYLLLWNTIIFKSFIKQKQQIYTWIQHFKCEDFSISLPIFISLQINASLCFDYCQKWAETLFFHHLGVKWLDAKLMHWQTKQLLCFSTFEVYLYL